MEEEDAASATVPPPETTTAVVLGETAPVEVVAMAEATTDIMTTIASSARSDSNKKLPPVNSSKPDFLNLPKTDKEVHSIDTTDGLWVKCSICDSSMNNKANPPRPFNIVLSRKPFTLVRWLEHKQTKSHISLLGSLKRRRLEEKMADGSITRFERGELNNCTKKQRCLMFLPKVRHEWPLTACDTCASNKGSSTSVAAVAVTEVVVDLSVDSPVANPTVSEATASPSAAMTKSCEGIIRGYKESGDVMLQDKIVKYIEYCSIDSENYTGGKVISNNLYNVFSRSCKPISAIYQKSTKMFQCSACHGIQ
jgi:hypothetical protein